MTPLFLAGDEKQVRILVQLVRDRETSFDGDFGAPVATVRHEVWQYTNHYGGWVKDRKTEVLDRILMAAERIPAVDLGVGTQARRHRGRGETGDDFVPAPRPLRPGDRSRLVPGLNGEIPPLLRCFVPRRDL